MVREEQMHHKLSAAQEAEEEKMAQFRALEPHCYLGCIACRHTWIILAFSSADRAH